MYTTPTYIAEKITHDYTRDRIRDAEASRTARAARSAAREHGHVDPAVAQAAPARRWRIFAARTSAA